MEFWKKKLADIVQAAKRIKAEEQHNALELWSAAFNEIQRAWNDSCSFQVSKESKANVLAQEEGGESPAKKKKEQFIRIKRLKKAEERKVEKKNRLEDVEMPSTRLVKHELGGNIVVEEQDDAVDVAKHELDGNIVVEEQDNAVDDAQEVQSVHLMISADPELMTQMNKFKKTERNEDTGKIETLYQCNMCHKQYHSAGTLDIHMKRHTEDRPFRCNECTSSFKTRGNLVRHRATHTGDKNWVCSVCGKSYTEKSSLKVHMRTHTGERPYSCNVCHKKFSQSGVLQVHMLTHTDKFAHLCDICGRSFRQRSQLIPHRLRHQGIRPYSCSECESKFTTKGDFGRHLRTHTGERPYHCDVCGSSFARLQTLQEHKNRHYNFKPYICKVCAKSFYELAACSRHVKHVHTRESNKASASGSILHFKDSPTYQEGVVKERIEMAAVNVESGTESRILEDGNSSLQADYDEVQDIKKEQERCELLVANNEKEVEVMAAAEQAASRDKHRNRNSEMACRDCGSVFSSYKGLSGHSRYCKHKKKGKNDLEPNPRVSTTITARIPGVPVTQWLAQNNANYSSRDEENIEENKYPEATIEATDETCESLEYVEEVEEHAFSIDEDGSITSVPFSQLAPIHIQLENEYMVVLSDTTKVQGDATSSFSARDIQQVEIEEQSHSISEGDNSEQRITLVLNP